MPLIRVETWHVLAGLGVASLYMLYRADRDRQKQKADVFAITKSPLKTIIPGLSQPQLESLAYPPDLVSGARDVQTPYGSFRAYELGSENGQKVLLVHGISTPCLSMIGMARHLVDKGCRVILYDLPGRGYSDNPLGHAHSEHLYTSQILAVLASSPISWGADSGFHLIGYSLGGGIAAAFTRSFPGLVTSLVLLAPSGLLRQKHIAWQSHLLYHTGGVLPESLIRFLVRRRLNNSKAHIENGNKDFHPEDAIMAELGDIKNENNINSKIDSAVQWQLENHPGFLDAFISSIRYAPITDQHEAFREIGRNISEDDAKMVNRKVVLLLGRTDPIILKDEIEPDVQETIGHDRVHTIVLDAGHDVAITKAEQVVQELCRFWKID